MRLIAGPCMMLAAASAASTTLWPACAACWLLVPCPLLSQGPTACSAGSTYLAIYLHAAAWCARPIVSCGVRPSAAAAFGLAHRPRVPHWMARGVGCLVRAQLIAVPCATFATALADGGTLLCC